jgi:hypothetical protein
MAHGLIHNLYFLDGWGWMFVPQQANRVQGDINIVRNCYHTLRLTAARTTDFDLASDLTLPSAALADWPTFTGATFGFKTQDNFEDSGDWTAAWSGFDTGDTAWHSPANKRYSLALAPTHATALAQYRLQIALTDGSVTVKLPDFPLYANLLQEMIVGDETTAPSGIASNTGTATITSGNSSVTVSFTGMTTAGYIIPFWTASPQSTLSATAGTNQFTINAGGPVAGNTTVGYFVVGTS